MASPGWQRLNWRGLLDGCRDHEAKGSSMIYKPRESSPFAGLKLIDANSHITEPENL